MPIVALRLTMIINGTGMGSAEHARSGAVWHGAAACLSEAKLSTTSLPVLLQGVRASTPWA